MRIGRWQRAGLAICVALGAQACSLSARFAQTTSDPAPAPPPDAAVGSRQPDARVELDARVEPEPPARDAGPSPPPTCASNLADRIKVSRIAVDADIRYKVASYDGYPVDERIALSVASDGHAYVAWIDTASNVRVTPLNANLTRRTTDVLVPGSEIGGLVALEDGFALVTRRPDPGDPPLKPETGDPVRAAFLVRYRDRTEVFAVPLTGTRSIGAADFPEARDCVPPHLYGRLAWNGVKFGAYFTVHGCQGDPHESFWADKLIYADGRGRYLRGGWNWNCGTNLGLRLLPEAGAFTAVCLADSRPSPGLNLVTEGVPFRQISPEFAVPGYVAAQFGSLVKVLADGSYAVAWLSRGVTTSQGRVASAKQANDVMLLRLDSEYMPLGPKKWLIETPDVAETNLHLGLYGSDRLLMIWERVESPRCPNDRTCWGPYSGTFARLMNLNGEALSVDTPMTALPNNGDDLSVFPEGDLGWAFVEEEERSYQNPLRDASRLPPKRALSVARMHVCE